MGDSREAVKSYAAIAQWIAMRSKQARLRAKVYCGYVLSIGKVIISEPTATLPGRSRRRSATNTPFDASAGGMEGPISARKRVTRPFINTAPFTQDLFGSEPHLRDLHVVRSTGECRFAGTDCLLIWFSERRS